MGGLFIDGVNYLFTNWLSTVQHECMGHGFRAREYRIRINRYVIPPTIFGQPYVDDHEDDLPYYGHLLYDAAGSESNTVFAREAFRQSFLNDYFYHYYFYTFVLKTDLLLYIIGTPPTNNPKWNVGWDVISYIKYFDDKSNKNIEEIYHSAKKNVLWGLADPSLLMSFFNYTRDFIIKGRSQVRNPMIRIKSVSFLPFTDFHFSLFGFEYYFGTYLNIIKLCMKDIIAGVQEILMAKAMV